MTREKGNGEHKQSQQTKNDEHNNEQYLIDSLSPISVLLLFSAVLVHLIFLVYHYHYFNERLKFESVPTIPTSMHHMYAYFIYELDCPQCITPQGLVVNTSVYVR